MAEKAAAHAGYTLTWKDVSLDITSKGMGGTKSIRTLKSACGYAKPGESLAIIGPSGAGKTTLLDILAQQKNLGDISGEILVNGKVPDRFFGKRAGYIFTSMAHIPTMTVRETLLFAAECRMPRSATPEERVARVDEVIKNLRMTNAANTFVGDELIRGVSSGEKKRLEVGIEMVAKPKALFFDEPTSGLDDYGARFTMELVLDYVRRENVTVMVVIHQPCEAVFKLFDNCCLVGEQGRICYFGPISRCEEHFASFGYPTPPLTNPIEHYLDVMALDTGRAHEFFEKSPVYQENLREIARLNALEHPDVPHSDNLVERLPFDQFKLIWNRCWLRYRRNPSTSWGRAFLFILFAFIFGLMFLNLDPGLSGIRNRLSVASTLSFLPIFIAVAAVPQFLEDRELYIQEYNSAFYSLWPFWITYLVIEGLYTTVISTIQLVIIFFMCNGFPTSSFGPTFGMMIVQVWLATTVSQAWSAWSKTLFQAYTALWAGGLIFYAFSGTQADLNTVQPWIRWMADINYWRWSQQYIDYQVLKDYTYECPTTSSVSFITGVVGGYKTSLIKTIAASNDTAIVAGASQALTALNALTLMKSIPGNTTETSLTLDIIIAGLKNQTLPLYAAGTNLSSIDSLIPANSLYGAVGLIDTQLKANSSVFTAQPYCPFGNNGAEWLAAFRGIGGDQPAITNWAYFANIMLFLFFGTMTYCGLWFSRRYRKR
ncbi:P-loop containing nucleoside triphosphate hydrolase protein [Gonapodya prolifera JEL478]|uniref:p-loop containing nucleoside triphosphate hydrolase protein n=1 Tax=Gonapodya prolifera (strain JEL478) TaxID=1344416 RepID=A0A139AWS0_GONPJ|nr:P-loop containing nucleoside triphosphate hydrolase protein [Gonapodya prolifera JEL478]|eukprot:KXS21192.1 P-loop containing nucleoside triphosphate hydrolase protein [Gonapodya prolifera JEL478]